MKVRIPPQIATGFEDDLQSALEGRPEQDQLGGTTVTFDTAIAILAATRPMRRKIDRYQQRDELQHFIIPRLDTKDRDKFERRMNRHFRL